MRSACPKLNPTSRMENSPSNPAYGYHYSVRPTQLDGGDYRLRYHNPVAQNNGFEVLHGDESQSKTIFVGNLDHSITEDFLRVLFGEYGTITKLKLIQDWGSFSVFAFVEFVDHLDGERAMAFNGRILFGRDMKVRRMFFPVAREKVDTTEHYHLYVGELDYQIDDAELKEIFGKFGAVSEARVIRDPESQRSKGFGFIAYPNREDAHRAIDEMNGRHVGKRAIRVNWSSRQAPVQRSADSMIGAPL